MAGNLELRRGKVEPSAHKPYVKGSSPFAATSSLINNNIACSGHGVKAVVPSTPHFIGETIAILLCSAANGKVFAVTIDREDLERVLAAGRWHVANFDSANGRVNLYCYTKANGRTLYLHRFILKAPKDRRIEVDHIRHRNLDNRKSQIRLATKSENQRNRRRAAFAAGASA